MLGVPAGALRNYLGGFPMPAEVARDIEWVMDLPMGWLDGEAAVSAAGSGRDEVALDDGALMVEETNPSAIVPPSSDAATPLGQQSTAVGC